METTMANAKNMSPHIITNRLKNFPSEKSCDE
jgi:hypothetical protein